MAGEEGFYLMHRGWQDHAVFRGEEFSRRDAFVWMIEEAAYKPRRVGVAQGEIELQRGQFTHSIRFMAKAWKWDEKRVRRFLQSCQNAEIIALATAAGQTVITICNYSVYQGDFVEGAAPDAAATPQQRRTDAANKKEGNKGNKEEDGVAGARDVPDPFGPIGELTARCGRAAGVTVVPTRRDFPDQLDEVRGWVELGLDPDTEIIPTLERDARSDGPPRYSLKYFTPAMNKLAARKAAPHERPDRPEAHSSPLTRAALRREAARDR